MEDIDTDGIGNTEDICKVAEAFGLGELVFAYAIAEANARKADERAKEEHEVGRALLDCAMTRFGQEAVAEVLSSRDYDDIKAAVKAVAGGENYDEDAVVRDIRGINAIYGGEDGEDDEHNDDCDNFLKCE